MQKMNRDTKENMVRQCTRRPSKYKSQGTGKSSEMEENNTAIQTKLIIKYIHSYNISIDLKKRS